MEDLEAKKKKVADFLNTVTSPGRLDLKFNILSPGDVSSAVAGAPGSNAELRVELSGADVPLLLARNGELLLALEHMAAKVLRYESDEHDRIYFDADNFKLLRHEELLRSAEMAVERVRRTGQPFAFAPMSSRERRQLHLALASSGLPTASSGEGPRRCVVLYPEGEGPGAGPSAGPSKEDRVAAIRARFRRR